MGGESAKSTARLFGIRPGCFGCMQAGPNWSAARTPLHLVTACGGFHRRAPTGGAPNGMPLKAATPGKRPATPAIRPSVVLTGARSNGGATALPASAALTAAAVSVAHTPINARSFEAILMSHPWILLRTPAL